MGKRNYAADTEWKRKNTRLFAIRLTRRTDQDMIDYIESKPSCNAYIVNLIRADMEAHKVDSEETD